jgi:FAD/FMN-containing dehydrogenase
MTQVPWWGVPLVAGLFALGGVLATQFTVVRLDQLRVKREDSRRWLADRRRIYASVLASAEGIYERVKIEWMSDNSASAYREELTSLRVLCQEVRLMSTREVNAAAWEIAERLKRVTQSPESRQKVSLEDWKEEYKDAMRRFASAARADINTNPDKWRPRPPTE